MKKFSQGCTLDCADCCKFNIYVEDNKIVKIEGNKEHPYTKGFICNKGRAHVERLNHPERIYMPLLKVNGQWQEISFEKAIEIMAEKLTYYKENFTSQSVLYYDQYGNGGLLKSIEDIFFNYYGGISKQKGGPCWSAGIHANRYDFGTPKSHSLEDMLNSKNIFVWGKNPSYTTTHTMAMIKKAKDNGSKIIVIDPIRTATASLADLYIRVNPGSDSALAFAMAKIIIKENLVDMDYISSNVLGFEQYKNYIDTLDLSYLCEECGVTEDVVTQLVSLYTKKYSTILLGYGVQKYKNGGNTIRSINALGAITGQIGFSGGGVNYANSVYPSAINSDPYGSDVYSNHRQCYISHLCKLITGELGTPIKMAVIAKSNMLNQLPNLNALEESFSKIDFKVCFDLFMTDTAKACDLFIPCTNTLESEDLIYSSMTNPYITYNEVVIEPKNPLMDEYYFFMELAKKMNMTNYPYVTKKEYLTKVIEPLKKYDSEITLEKLKDSSFTIHEPVAWKDKNFSTPSGKYELYSEKAKNNDVSPIPVYIKCIKENKFRLLTNHGRESTSSQHFLDKEGTSSCYINNKMASQLNINSNDTVTLKSKDGTLDVTIIIDDNIGDYIAMMYVGWWKKHGNPNVLTMSGISDFGGQLTYNETFVNIIKR